MPNSINSKTSTLEIVGVGAIFIDDIVLPDGTTHMGELGGGAIHALIGASLWAKHTGLSGFYGQDLPADILPYLSQHMNIEGLIELDIPQMRAWQLFEEDGRRTEVHRVSITQPFTEGTQPHHLPLSYQSASAYYLLQDFEGIHKWIKAIDGFIFWEPNQLVMTSDKRDAMRDVLQTGKIDVVSPNLVEAKAIYGNLSPDDLVHQMLADGAKKVALRMGEQGSIIADKITGEKHHISVINVENIVDQTGAGNTYCGGLLAGLVQGKSLHTSAIMGTVCASFCLETIGVLKPEHINSQECNNRVQALMSLK